ncbi:PP2C family protein-serine/threonine phosphatase [Nocardioides dongkuii]|uniref:PP2C family protein-serine/threonine phosphatase n=1 Tax=Nocardioides dongkuii TaxID=2760089 RepID=UPI0015FA6A1B|nr:PP2C family protein-serine/threonine phosphatase [Nocardioides dongkuii]
MSGALDRWSDRFSRYAHERVLGWRTGSRQSQKLVLYVLLTCVAVSFVVSMIDYSLMPITAYFLWLLLGMLLLRFRPLAVLAAVTSAAAVTATLTSAPLSGARVAALVTLGLSVALILFQSSRQRSGLPAALGEAMLADLRELQKAQGTIPPLPPGWSSQSSMIAAHGVGYAGDFLVADLARDGQQFEMVLVDVCGNGVAASPRALQLSGALGGLIGALPQRELLWAANDFLLRQTADESFATAVHVLVDLRSGEYGIVSAGHPPALRWDAQAQEWMIDNARGTMLGIDPEPDLHASAGVLRPGDALMFYTDGVVESRDNDLDTGIAWLRTTGRDAMAAGLDGAARRIIRKVDRGDDDRAVLILARTP